MTIVVRSNSKYVTVECGNMCLIHEVPRKNRFFKEELRQYREELRAMIRGRFCRELIVYNPFRLSFYRRVLYLAIVKTVQEQGLPLIITLRESEEVTR